MTKFKRVAVWAVIALAVAVGVAAAGTWWWVMKRPVPMKTAVVDYIVEQGSGPRAVARQLLEAGIAVNVDQFVALSRLSKKDTLLQAGAYEAKQGDTLWTLLDRMVIGDMTHRSITIIEGWTYQRMREAIASHSDIRNTLEGVSDKELLARLGSSYTHPEGLFYPDTYVFVPGSTDFELLRRSYVAQQDLLNELWEKRSEGLPLSTPYEALILASIVEKETGHAPDRQRVAGVFTNRLKVKMPLQTDPTVIYGMGERYESGGRRIRRVDLQTDTPWNTYTRNGLPPTPIALVGKAAIEAALHPETHRYYYFVSRGDGTSEFSENLAAHNRAVAKYILRRN